MVHWTFNKKFKFKVPAIRLGNCNYWLVTWIIIIYFDNYSYLKTLIITILSKLITMKPLWWVTLTIIVLDIVCIVEKLKKKLLKEWIAFHTKMFGSFARYGRSVLMKRETECGVCVLMSHGGLCNWDRVNVFNLFIAFSTNGVYTFIFCLYLIKYNGWKLGYSSCW
jgi:hypothetical protein